MYKQKETRNKVGEKFTIFIVSNKSSSCGAFILFKEDFYYKIVNTYAS